MWSYHAVAAVLRGSDPRLKDEYVVLTAHLDHVGVGEPVDGDAIYNGAYDNASGVAILLEVANAFTRLPVPPRRSVLFLAVTGEEEGLNGSSFFAHYPTVPIDRIVANVNLDMIQMLFPLRDVAPGTGGRGRVRVGPTPSRSNAASRVPTLRAVARWPPRKAEAVATPMPASAVRAPARCRSRERAAYDVPSRARAAVLSSAWATPTRRSGFAVSCHSAKPVAAVGTAVSRPRPRSRRAASREPSPPSTSARCYQS